MHRQPYRLGIDIGTSSLGWSVIDLKKVGTDEVGKPRYETIGLRRIGVRIFSDSRDPQSGASLAMERRGPRGMRRRRDRYLDRRNDLMGLLVRHGLMPADTLARKALEPLDPYRLRAVGLDEPLDPHHFGRALFHLNQRRGFKSNRKTDKGKDEKEEKETAGMKGGVERLDRKIAEAGCRTLGEFLWKTARAGREVRDMLPVRARSRIVKGRSEYDIYPSRAMYEQEFDALWAAQQRLNPSLTNGMRDDLRDAIFFQRRLKPVDPGNCTFIPADPRAPIALPLQQEFRILQELANLEMESAVDRTRKRLTLAQRDTLLRMMEVRDKLTFAQIRKALDLPSIWKFNLEDERRNELKGDAVGARLSNDKCFGARWWRDRTPAGDAWRESVILTLLDEENEEALIARATADWGVDEGAAKAIAAVRLPDGYGRLGRPALGRIVDEMRKDVVVYADACIRAGFHHSDFRDGEILDELPYYGAILSRYTAPVTSPSAAAEEREHGRIANPTVHVGLNQLRKVINALIARYGHPAEIVVELARDLKMNAEQKEEFKRKQTDNKKKNDLRRQKLEEIEKETGVRLLDRPDSMLRMRLWEELGGDPLNRQCVYTGQKISGAMLFSDAVDIDHILPFRRSLDDSPANLVVSMRRANRFKGNNTPAEAFKSDPVVDGVKCSWDAIWTRSQDLPANKRWRFREDAMEIVKEKARRTLLRERNELPADVLREIEENAFIARQLVDTAYLARVARLYLSKVCALGPDRVRVIPGGLTGLLRRNWGLNRLLYGNRPDPEEEGVKTAPKIAKKRDDHRHHALDAVVIAVTSPALLQQVAAAADQETRDRLIEKLPFPWDGFRNDVNEHLQRLAGGGHIAVSYRPEHATQGRLHEETAYGLVRDPDKEGGNLVYRKSIEALNANEIGRVRDLRLRDLLTKELGPLLFDERQLDAAKERQKLARKAKDIAAADRWAAEIVRLKQVKKESKKAGAKDLRTALAAFGEQHKVRRVRLLKTDASAISIEDRTTGKPYKAVSAGDNNRVDVFRRADGSYGAEIVTVFDANRKSFRARWIAQEPGASLFASFYKNDLVRLSIDGAERTMRVVSLWEKFLQLAGHRETNLAERYREGTFKWTFANYSKFGEYGLRKVSVTPLGDVIDPGPPPA